MSTVIGSSSTHAAEGSIQANSLQPDQRPPHSSSADPWIWQVRSQHLSRPSMSVERAAGGVEHGAVRGIGYSLDFSFVDK